jgi:hypothetical protein
MSVNLSENGNESIDDRVLVEGVDYFVFGTNDDGTKRRLYRNARDSIVFGWLNGRAIILHRYEAEGIGVYIGKKDDFPTSRQSNEIDPQKKKSLWQRVKPYLGLEYSL